VDRDVYLFILMCVYTKNEYALKGENVLTAFCVLDDFATLQFGLSLLSFQFVIYRFLMGVC
jgi:hypothetical protein